MGKKLSGRVGKNFQGVWVKNLQGVWVKTFRACGEKLSGRVGKNCQGVWGKTCSIVKISSYMCFSMFFLCFSFLIHIKKPKCLGCTSAVLFYLFSASIAFIFCFTSSRSSLSFCTFRFISSTRLFPFLLAALRKPRLFS